MVHTATHILHTLGIAAEHLNISQHVVAEADGLGDLQMGETGQDDLDIFSGNGQQRFLQLGEQLTNQVNLAAQPQAHIGGDLVVAAAARVQAFASVAHQSGQARFNVEVHVF